MASVEEHLERIEKLLVMVLRRLESLEERAGVAEREARAAAEIALAFSVPAVQAVRAARRLVKLSSIAPVGEDGLTRAILEALVTRGPLSLRGLEREVRRVRGSATRSLIRERVARLEELGIVRVERRGRRLLISLAGGGDEAA